MIAYIVCEGLFDEQLLTTVLPGELLNDVKVVSAGGVSAVKSLARSLVVRRQVPVVIVVDADSVVPELVQELLKDIEEIVESVAINTPVKVIAAVPDMETIFFQLLSKSEKIAHRSQIITQLTQEDIEILRSSSVMQEIIHFLQSVHETAKAL